MKVKYKAFLISIISGLFLVTTTWLIFYFVYFGYVNSQQNKYMEKNMIAADFVVKNEESNLIGNLIDWSVWDDTYEFIKNNDRDYINVNLQDNTFTALNIEMMTFIDSNNKIVFTKTLDLNSDEVEYINEKAIEEINALKVQEVNFSPKSGLYFYNGKLYILALGPITNSNKDVNSNGVLVFIREIDKDIISYINDITGTVLSVKSLNEMNESTIYNKTSKISIQDNKDYLEMHKKIKNIDEEDSIVFSMKVKNDSFKSIIKYFLLFILHFFLLIVFILAIDIYVVDKYILRRLSRLYKFISNVTETKDTNLTIEMGGSDEFFNISNATNNMLSELNSVYSDIKKMDERFRLIMEATNDGYLDFYLKEKEIYISEQWKNIIGYKGNDGTDLYKNYVSRIHPDSMEVIKLKYYELEQGNVENFCIEYKVFKENGEIIWVEQRGKVATKDDDNKPIRIVSTLSDITERKKYNENIHFLSYSDKLTQLKNRAYMEEKFELLDKEGNINYSIIMGDLNGLKLTNDVLGHKEGDKLLNIISNILLSVCEEDDIVARWGGDEFVILILNKKEEYGVLLMEKIKEACLQQPEFNLNTSISLGYAKMDKENSDTQAVMSLAEKRMYRNKLMENKSARSSTISSLLRSLHEKNSETEEHTIRLKELSFKLGKRLQLPQDKLDELELLSLLHDIGKIGIPEQILLKPSKLTKDEWEIMKAHTEMGYRIAKSTPELSHIAEAILCHHERYDGTGYPGGIKGEEIPLISRIISVVDSYDVMTHERVYKQAYSREDSINEIKRCSGTQFDPMIVEEFLSIFDENKEL